MYFLNLKKFKKLNTLKNTYNNPFYKELKTTSKNNKKVLSSNTFTFKSFNIFKTLSISPLLVRGGGAF
ncbi:hypothetical protein B6S12_10820 [Helicobacter valdiviensis]|uniref:Uncharacterized protein n=1 Tax=Helicobacter valdiviensis TaxID=1458358 RepID=A0A2W6MSZ4_9HELI|nr:hypothetical protein B6S12_10820 [Helicobacter valdiviensis]